MKIQVLKNNIYHNCNNFNFRKKLNYNSEKESYVNAHTKDLENLTMGMAFLTLTSETLEYSDVLGKERKSKIPLVLLSITLVLLLITCIKKIQFSKKYNEVKENGTKNYA